MVLLAPWRVWYSLSHCAPCIMSFTPLLGGTLECLVLVFSFSVLAGVLAGQLPPSLCGVHFQGCLLVLGRIHYFCYTDRQWLLKRGRYIRYACSGTVCVLYRVIDYQQKCQRRVLEKWLTQCRALPGSLSFVKPTETVVVETDLDRSNVFQLCIFFFFLI